MPRAFADEVDSLKSEVDSPGWSLKSDSHGPLSDATDRGIACDWYKWLQLHMQIRCSSVCEVDDPCLIPGAKLPGAVETRVS
jgi:hypothetical protein